MGFDLECPHPSFQENQSPSTSTYEDRHDDLVFSKGSVFVLLVGAQAVVQVGVKVITVVKAPLHLKRLSRQLVHLLVF
jgi:hypothetical protein